MKKLITSAFVLSITLLLITACTISDKGKLDLSKVSFEVDFDSANMVQDFGVYNEKENEVGIVVYGKVKSGKIYEKSPLVFIDKDGEVLHNDEVFKIMIIEANTETEQKSRRQNYAESSDDVALYLKGWSANDMEMYSKYEKNLELIRKSHFIENAK